MSGVLENPACFGDHWVHDALDQVVVRYPIWKAVDFPIWTDTLGTTQRGTGIKIPDRGWEGGPPLATKKIWNPPAEGLIRTSVYTGYTT